MFEWKLIQQNPHLASMLIYWRVTPQTTIWLFNIAMENPNINGAFNGKIIYKWAIYTMAMLNNKRVNMGK